MHKPNKLYIIGNGFDLHHRVKSSYNDFKTYLSKVDTILLDELNLFIDCENLWGDFENNLAFLSRELIMEAVDSFLPKCDPEDDDFSYADFEIGIEQATSRVWLFTENLKIHFHKWIRYLKVTSDYDKYLIILDNKATYINFNYTLFLESLYKIPGEQIIYLHGREDDKLSSIVLGHGEDPNQNLSNWINENSNQKRFQSYIRNKKGKYYPNKRLSYIAWFASEEEALKRINTCQFYALDRGIVGDIEEYYEVSRKNIEETLEKHKAELDKLKNINEIYVLGHSLSKVDWPYFQYLLTQNQEPESIKWCISYLTDDDKEKIDCFINHFKINKEEIRLFQLNEIQIRSSIT